MKYLFFFFLFLFFISVVFAEGNQTDAERASLCIKNSLLILNEMSYANLSVTRVNDSIIEMQEMYDSQSFLALVHKRSDFSSILNSCEEVSRVRNLAFESQDGFRALLLFYNETVGEDINSSSIDAILSQIRLEMDNERYERVPPLLDSAYSEITYVTSQQRAVGLFYRSTTRSLRGFFEEYWRYLLVAGLVFISLFGIYHKTLRRWFIYRHISFLEFRKEIIKDLIKQLQSKYFDEGSISENDYTIRSKKFAELIRDINRQIPLLREQLAKIKK